MKKQIYLFATALAIAIAGCSDDEFNEEQRIPVQTGEEIIFGSSLTGNPENEERKGIDTRTVYGKRTETGIPVYWQNEEPYDEIAIFCPQVSAPANKLVKYKVIPDPTHHNQSASVVKIDPNAAGLQWGSENEHHFYAIYPASIVHQTAESAVKGIITAELPVRQNPTGWHIETKQPTIGNKRFNKVIFGEPNMDLAVMFANKEVNKDTINANQPLNLLFKNLVTVVDITIPGPRSGSITITNVNLTCTHAQSPIVGKFNIHTRPYTEGGHTFKVGECQPIKENKVQNGLSISCYMPNAENPENGTFVTLGPGDALNLKAYIIPDTDQPLRQGNLKVTVSTLNGVDKSRTLVKADVKPHKINRVLLDNIDSTGEPIAWMANLDDDIYLTELSIPGSKFSYLTESNGAKPAYQTNNIAEQFKTGIRGFIVQTGSQTTYTESRKQVGGTQWWPQYEYSYKHKSTEMPVTGAKSGTTLENTIKDITNALQNGKETECAFIVLTCNSKDVQEHKYVTDGTYNRVGGKGVPDAGWHQRWIEAVKYYVKYLTEKGYPIYKDPITANTTLGDVRGNIIIKVNYNEVPQENFIEPNAGVKALFSKWINPKNSSDFTPISDLRWGSPSNSNLQMQWMCAEATNIGESAELTEMEKKKSIENIFKNSVIKYNDPENKHDTYFMADIGGVYTSDQSTTRLAKEMNMHAVNALQNRKQNASTGLVFMNFADRDYNSGMQYRSDYIIATVIDNNFKFALRKKGSK